MVGGLVAVMRKAERRVAIVVGAESDVGVLLRPIGDGRLDDVCWQPGDGYGGSDPTEVVAINQIRIAVLTQCNDKMGRRCAGHVHQQWAGATQDPSRRYRGICQFLGTQ